MVEFVDSLKQKKFHKIISEDLLKYTPKKCDLLDPFLGPTLHRIFHSLLGMTFDVPFYPLGVMGDFWKNDKQNGQKSYFILALLWPSIFIAFI
jgi:hypothetical protein